MKPQKTNAMRLLDSLKLPYEPVSYPSDGTAIDATRVAELLNEPPENIFKTLVLLGSDSRHYVCLLPGPRELDLKAAAVHFKVKSLQMEHAADLKAITGYVRGGCSPLGMKKSFPTASEESAGRQPYILISAGIIGQQLKLAPKTLGQAHAMDHVSLSKTKYIKDK